MELRNGDLQGLSCCNCIAEPLRQVGLLPRVYAEAIACPRETPELSQ